MFLVLDVIVIDLVIFLVYKYTHVTNIMSLSIARYHKFYTVINNFHS